MKAWGQLFGYLSSDTNPPCINAVAVIDVAHAAYATLVDSVSAIESNRSCESRIGTKKKHKGDDNSPDHAALFLPAFIRGLTGK